MWRLVGKLDKNAYLWQNRVNKTWIITLDNTKPIEPAGFYSLAMLLMSEGI